MTDNRYSLGCLSLPRSSHRHLRNDFFFFFEKSSQNRNSALFHVSSIKIHQSWEARGTGGQPELGTASGTVRVQQSRMVTVPSPASPVYFLYRPHGDLVDLSACLFLFVPHLVWNVSEAHESWDCRCSRS